MASLTVCPWHGDWKFRSENGKVREPGLCRGDQAAFVSGHAVENNRVLDCMCPSHRRIQGGGATTLERSCPSSRHGRGRLSSPREEGPIRVVGISTTVIGL